MSFENCISELFRRVGYKSFVQLTNVKSNLNQLQSTNCNFQLETTRKFDGLQPLNSIKLESNLVLKWIQPYCVAQSNRYLSGSKQAMSSQASEHYRGV